MSEKVSKKRIAYRVLSCIFYVLVIFALMTDQFRTVLSVMIDVMQVFGAVGHVIGLFTIIAVSMFMAAGVLDSLPVTHCSVCKGEGGECKHCHGSGAEPIELDFTRSGW